MRLVGLVTISPPGLSHDEVANWLIDRQILSGEHAIYFSDAYGHEAAFHYLQAGFVGLIGDNALALRLPAAFAGILLIPLVAALAHRLFNRRIAIIAAGLCAPLFWSVFFSRQGLRAITLPLIAGISAIFWRRAWRYWGAKADRRVYRNAILAAFFAGVSLYSYTAARAIPIFYILYFLYLTGVHRKKLAANWIGVPLFLAVMGAVALPLALFLQSMPGIETRVAEVNLPLQAALAGDLRPILSNGLKIAGMFGWAGDPLWRHNITGKPVFEPIGALLFYAGILAALIRWRDEKQAFILLWLAVSFIPTLVTIDAPSSIRAINSLPILTIFPALAVELIHKLFPLSTNNPQLSTERGKYKEIFINGAAAALVLWYAVSNSGLLLQKWANNDDVKFVWQAAFHDAADWLDAHPKVKNAGIIGWSPDTRDVPTMALETKRQDTILRHMGIHQETGKTALLPASDYPYALIRPAILPLDPALEQLLSGWSSPRQLDTIIIYEFDAPIEPQPAKAAHILFGGELLLLGWEFSQTDGAIRGTTFWQVASQPSGERRIFLHALNQNGGIMGQEDALAAPARFWQVGDYLIQRHELPATTPLPHQLKLGVYQPPQGNRLQTPEGADSVLIELQR